MAIVNPWEARALQYHFEESSDTSGTTHTATQISLTGSDTVHDPIIYPGIYSASGLDVMGILWRLAQRPNPVIDVGFVDASCAFVICDLSQTDYPIIYASEPVTHLTGYSQREILGRNCRFLQAPGGRVQKSSRRQYVDKALVKQMRRAIERFEEISVEVVNFKKNSQPFVNVLTMIPVSYGGTTPEYFVGFMAEKQPGW